MLILSLKRGLKPIGFTCTGDVLPVSPRNSPDEEGIETDVELRRFFGHIQSEE